MASRRRIAAVGEVCIDRYVDRGIGTRRDVDAVDRGIGTRRDVDAVDRGIGTRRDVDVPGGVDMLGGARRDIDARGGVDMPGGVDMLGGCSCNFARAAADAGADAALFAAVGDDERGRDVLACLAATPLALRVRTERGATALQRIRSAPDGERQFCGWEPGVVATYQLTPGELTDLATYDVIALADTPAWQQCLALAGPKRVADFSRDADTPWNFTGLDIAFVGGTPADLPRLRELASSAPLIVLTAGAHGAWAITPTGILHQPTLATSIVDTTGCGDAFQAAFTVAHFSGASLSEALLASARAAANTAARLGA